MADERPRCPACGSTDVVKIVYGMPTYDTYLEAEAGRIALGGCLVGASDPAKHCKSCGTDFEPLGDGR